MVEKTPNEGMLMFPSHESTLESLRYAKEDLDIANGRIEELEAENSRISEFEAEIRRLTAELKGK